MKKILLTSFTFIILCAVLITGCGKKKEVSPYEKAVQEFTDNITAYGNEIDSLDVNNPDSKTQLLASLDKMNDCFKTMQEYNAPEKYQACDEIIEKAAGFMDQANVLYHQALEAEVFDSVLYESARAQYNEAMKYASYMGQALMGQDIIVSQNQVSE